MESTFWHNKWKSKEIGFHQAEVNPQLLEYWPPLGVAAGGQVFVPLSGKSRDMLWLMEQQHVVVGIELSEIAVREFFIESNLQAQPNPKDGMAGYEADGIALYCGDFFDLPEQKISVSAAVYDRAALIALPAEMRRRYAARITSALQPGTPMLLITLEYDETSFAGPPFCIREPEVRHLYGANFQIEALGILQEDFKGMRVCNRAYRLIRN